jgi:hypothetical protein
MTCRSVDSTMIQTAEIHAAEIPTAGARVALVISFCAKALLRITCSRGGCLPANVASRLPAAAVFAAIALVVAVVVGAPARAENVEVSARRSAERTGFTNDEIVDGFFKIAFGAELRVTGGPDRIRKFEAPVRVFVDNRAQADRRDLIASVVADIRQHVDQLDIALTDDRRAANVVVILVRNRDLKRTIRSFYGPGLARQIEQRLTPECLSGFSEGQSEACPPSSYPRGHGAKSAPLPTLLIGFMVSIY